MMTVLDLFSGVGGFSLGLERTGGFKTVAFCEIEPFCRKVLAKHWPGVPCYGDIRTMEAYRTAEAPGNGFVRWRPLARETCGDVRSKSSIDVGRAATTDETTRPNSCSSTQGAQRNSQKASNGVAALPITGGADYARTDPADSGTGPSLPLVRRSGERHRSHCSSVEGRADGIAESATPLSPLSSREIQAGQEGGLNGSHADIGPIDVICGGFP